MGKVINILHVEDDPNDYLLLELALKRAGLPISITSARSGEEAIQHLEACLVPGSGRTLPDIVLLDINLPGIHGINTLARIRGDRRLHGIKVYVLTDWDDPAKREVAWELGATQYLVKSPTFSEVIAVVAGHGV